jgi:hypothetical protein
LPLDVILSSSEEGNLVLVSAEVARLDGANGLFTVHRYIDLIIYFVLPHKNNVVPYRILAYVFHTRQLLFTSELTKQMQLDFHYMPKIAK